jgi:hypothetical protein
VTFRWLRLRFGLGLMLAGGAGITFAGEPLVPGGDLAAFMRHAADAVCAPDTVAGDDLVRRLGGRLIEDRVYDFQGVPGRSVHRVALPTGDEVTVVRLFSGGRLRRLTIEYHQAVKTNGTRPVMALWLDHQCRVQEARRIDYDAVGIASNLAVLAPDLTTVQAREPLNPPVPEGRDPGGVTVALVDTGINYTLPAVASRLARDPEGRLLGYDFWDMDDRPFDVDPSRSPFFPLHHGTAVASIMAREAPPAGWCPTVSRGRPWRVWRTSSPMPIVRALSSSYCQWAATTAPTGRHSKKPPGLGRTCCSWSRPATTAATSMRHRSIRRRSGLTTF